jgi:hypothetical protein
MPGADPTIWELTTTTPALQRAGAFFKVEEKKNISKRTRLLGAINFYNALYITRSRRIGARMYILQKILFGVTEVNNNQSQLHSNHYHLASLQKIIPQRPVSRITYMYLYLPRTYVHI